MHNQDGSMVRTGGRVLRIMKLEEMLARVTEEKKQVSAPVDECKAANKILQDELAKEELTPLGALHEYRRLQMEVQVLMAERELLSKTTQEPVLKSSRNPASSS